MRKTVTVFFMVLCASLATSATAQTLEFGLNVPLSPEFKAPYTAAIHSGARGVTGPYDLDGDGKMEVLLTDYTGGGRVHVVENTSPGMWELVYTTPWQDSTATPNNARYAIGSDLDGDGKGEILFIGGHSYSTYNPNAALFKRGIYVYEYTGTDNDYGTMPAAVVVPVSKTAVGVHGSNLLAEQFSADDVDGDGRDELLLPANGTNAYDIFYIIGVTGDIGSGFEFFDTEAELAPRTLGTTHGGGSPYAILPANLDGEGLTELSLHSWNSYNFLNADVLGPNSYRFPAEGEMNTHLAASAPDDNVALFGGVVADMDGNGDDEVFYPEYPTGNLSMLNYEPGEDPLQITTDNFIYSMVKGVSSLGITAGDIDGDDMPELIASGLSYTPGQYNNPDNNLPTFLRVVKFTGGNVEDPANYSVHNIRYAEEFDTSSVQFDFVIQDSAGVIKEFLRDTGSRGGQGPVFVSKLAYLGDLDSDGDYEVAAAFQGLDDTTFVFREVFNPEDSTYTRTVVDARPAAQRTFLRILSFKGDEIVAVEKVDLPTGYALGANYPNPFSSETSFTFTLPKPENVSVKVFDITGRLVRTIVRDQMYGSGTHPLEWDGRTDAGLPAASGTYIYSLEHDGSRQSHKMVLVK